MCIMAAILSHGTSLKFGNSLWISKLLKIDDCFGEHLAMTIKISR